MGVALADGLYGLVGALGIAGLTNLLTGYQTMLRAIGELALVYLGGKAVFSKISLSIDRAVPTSRSLARAFVSIFLLTLSNPMTVLFFSAVIAGISPGAVETIGTFSKQAGYFAAGVFAGSFTWWVILTS